ncbi:hypothetical protein WMY93_020988 [Mugilogobius chulae]|uniref:Uncharacterized protein n=1 Tax=Mugilogobius chulae TaxID=88201 RepID=A0AAW0NGH7_9GOBI
MADRRANLERIVENVKTPVRRKSKRFKPNLEHPFDLMATAKTTHEITWRLARRVGVSETQHRHDKPSYAQWVEAWRSSAFQNGSYQSNQQNTWMQWMASSLEIQAKKEIISVHCAENKMFKAKFLDKVWCDSWKVGTVSQKCPPRNLQPEVSNESWVKTSPNTCYYVVMWSNQKNNRKYYINTEFTNNSRVSKLWGGSQQFLQSFSPKSVKKGKATGQPTDPRVILVKKEKLRKQQYVNLERKDMKPDKKWAGCHLLGKTQPKPKRGGAVKTVKLQEDSGKEKLEEWAESWRFLVRPEGQKKQVKSLRGWEEAWKMLVPPYQMPKAPKAK